MGHRHNVLTDDVFKNSKYIAFVEKTHNIKNFRKEYKEHYDMILDIYKTFILLNNCFFSDNNLSNADKVENALKIMEELLFVDYEESEKHKYRVQDIRDILDKRCRHIYNLIEEWHNDLESLTSKDINNSITLKNIKKDIEKEMADLEFAEFDSINLENISYQKNTIKNYRNYTKYFSKFDNIYIKSKEFKQKFKNKFYENNGIKLDDNDLNKLVLLFKLLSSLNNGLVNIITDYKLDEEISQGTSVDELYKIYLESCNIDYENENFIDNSRDFLCFQGIIKNKIDEEIKFNNTILLERFDLFFFYLTMEQCFYSHKIKVKSDFINKLQNDLIDIYKQFKDIKKKEKEQSIESKIDYDNTILGDITIDYFYDYIETMLLELNDKGILEYDRNKIRENSDTRRNYLKAFSFLREVVNPKDEDDEKYDLKMTQRSLKNIFIYLV